MTTQNNERDTLDYSENPKGEDIVASKSDDTNDKTDPPAPPAPVSNR